MQYPIRLAWAITIHKSQGLTFERAIIDTGDAFAAGQSYVALSRCTSLEGIALLSQITQRSVQTDSYAVQLSKSEKEEALLLKELEEGKKRFWAERLLLYFDCRGLFDITREFNKLLEDKTTEDYDAARKLASNMTRHAREIREVAVKFQAQLKTIVAQQTDDIELLAERCSKAVIYFHKEIVERMMLPLQNYINGFRIKKAKTFHKHLCGLELDLKMFVENMKKARFNDIPLVKDLVLTFPERDKLYQQTHQTTVEEYKQDVKKEKKPKKEKQESSEIIVSTAQQSLNLFREGLSIQEIANMRNLVESTIAMHLSKYVLTGELTAAELVSQETIDELTPWVQVAIAEDDIKLSAIKKKVEPRFSYGDIQIVLNHCLNKHE